MYIAVADGDWSRLFRSPVCKAFDPRGESFTSKNTHSLSCRKGACAASAITFRVQPFGAGHRRREFGLQTLLSLFQRIERWLSIKLRGIRLWRCQSSAWISLGLAYFCFEFSNVLPHGPAWAMGD